MFQTSRSDHVLSMFTAHYGVSIEAADGVQSSDGIIDHNDTATVASGLLSESSV